MPSSIPLSTRSNARSRMWAPHRAAPTPFARGLALQLLHRERGPMTSIAKRLRSVRWTLAFVLALGLVAGLIGGRDAGARDRERARWVAAWGFSIQGLAPATTIVANETVRMIARPTISGGFVRVLLENTFATVPLTISSAFIR